MTETAAPSPYRVLARKYRPSRFAELIGQDALVRTLTNALASGRLAHAFILTGVRGVGKTTTARIIARALNCVGADGTGGPTPEPCGACEHCRAITEDRHLDVLEMDAASRTGVEDIRELIDGVRYAPVSARYKIYIIDEVHMLSKSAFNALLKTLEEPPPHVVFIFATTEARKVPVTVLSRCQRFDLRRVEAEVLSRHFQEIAEKEGVALEGGALALIVRAAEGSVRDGLSLLDQAIAHGAGEVREAQVREMLGLADRGQVLDLFDAVMRGEVGEALGLLGEQYAAGADPAAVLQDLLEFSHWLTRLKVAPDLGEDVTLPEEARARGREMADKLSLAGLSRTWQILLKGLDEVRRAPAALTAAEMVLIRLAHAADLPTPAELVRALSEEGEGERAAPSAALPAAASSPRGGRGRAAEAAAPERARGLSEPEPAPAPRAQAPARPQSFAEVVALAAAEREAVLHARLINYVHLVHFEPGRIEFRPADGAPATLAHDLAARLGAWTGERWIVSVSRDDGAPTLSQAAHAEDQAQRAAAESDPLVRRVMETFPGAELREVREVPEGGAPPGAPADDGT